MPEDTSALDTLPAFEPLTLLDRCDTGNCGAAAQERITFTAGVLLFCGHHAAKVKASQLASV